jgi:hypothetical protein
MRLLEVQFINEIKPHFSEPILEVGRLRTRIPMMFIDDQD